MPEIRIKPLALTLALVQAGGAAVFDAAAPGASPLADAESRARA